MKSTLLLLAIGITTVMAQTEREEKFKVAGNCGMCETRIENAATAVEGVKEADWDRETRMLKLMFDPGRTTLHKVQMAIAATGHDTEMHRASDKVYNALPDCCKYERLEYAEKMNESPVED